MLSDLDTAEKETGPGSSRINYESLVQNNMRIGQETLRSLHHEASYVQICKLSSD